MPHHLASRVLYSIKYTPTEIITEISGLNIWRWILIIYQTQTTDCAHLWIYSLKARVLWMPATVSRYITIVPRPRRILSRPDVNASKETTEPCFRIWIVKFRYHISVWQSDFLFYFLELHMSAAHQRVISRTGYFQGVSVKNYSTLNPSSSLHLPCHSVTFA
jgi:hypothetical protein